jgi:hypothetical protein
MEKENDMYDKKALLLSFYVKIKTMTNLLTIRNFHFFIYSYIIPLFIEVLCQDANSSSFENSAPVFASIYLTFFNFYWLYLLGTNLNKKNHPKRFLEIRKFKNALIFTYSYFLMLQISLLYIFIVLEESDKLILIAAIICAIIPFFSYLYCVSFIVKSINEINYPVNTQAGNLKLNFLSFLYLPIGIWIIQPQINRIFNSSMPSLGTILMKIIKYLKK